MSNSNPRAERIGFLLCMQPAEAQFFRVLLGGLEPAWMFRVANLQQLAERVNSLDGPARLISFGSDIVVPGAIIDRLDAQCFNFHPGPPERPGYRPAAFAAAERAKSFGVTFHSMIDEINAGPIYAQRRFSVEDRADEDTIAVEAHGHLLWLAAEVAGALADPCPRFEPLPIDWGPVRTTRRDYAALNASPIEPAVARSSTPARSAFGVGRPEGENIVHNWVKRK